MVSNYLINLSLQVKPKCRKFLLALLVTQTIPNILFIKENDSLVDTYLFIYTERVKKELERIISIVNIEKPIQKVEIDAFNLKAIKQELDKFKPT